jgi:DNA polymerase-4
MERALSLHTYPRAILHIDADSFFASCEQALNPALKGKPLITGKERGIASAVSIEAKKLGVKRGMSIYEIKKLCPDIIYVPSDYETYSLFSKRMFDVVRRYTNSVEEYSIDECFAELTGLRRSLRMSYEAIAGAIQRDLARDLGITFSVGLAPTKVVAKAASKKRKPSGLVMVPGRELHTFLRDIPVGDVWGIGPQTEALLRSFDITTALQLARKDEHWVRTTLTKPHIEIWQELRGNSVLPVHTGERSDYQSISKTKTFTPPSADRSFILAQLSKNAENACIKARRHKLAGKRLVLLLRTQEYRHAVCEVSLSRKTSNPTTLMSLINAHLDSIYRHGVEYRATGITLAELERDDPDQLDLFGEYVIAEKFRRVFDAVDVLDQAFGKHSVFLGTSLLALRGAGHVGERADRPGRSANLFRGEGQRRRIGIPMLGDVL